MAIPHNFTVNYDDFFRWYQNYQNSHSIASVAHTGNSFVCLSQSSSLRPWILDSGASNHVTSNKNLFYSLSTSSFLSTITSVNGSQT